MFPLNLQLPYLPKMTSTKSSLMYLGNVLNQYINGHHVVLHPSHFQYITLRTAISTDKNISFLLPLIKSYNDIRFHATSASILLT